MLKSALDIVLLVTVVLCLGTATIAFGGVLPEYALPLVVLVTLLATFWAAKLLLCRRVPVVWSPMHVPVLLFAGYAAYRYAVSPIEYESRFELYQVGMYTFIYFLVASNLHRTRDRLVIVGALLILAIGEAAYALWQFRTHADAVLWLDRGTNYHGRGSGTYFCPNHLAGMFEMTLAILIARLLVHRHPLGDLQSTLLIKLYEVAAAVFVALGLFATLSRGGWIATAVALLALLVWAEKARVLSSRLVISVFVTILLIGVAAWNIPRVRDRIEQDVRVRLDYVPGDSPIQIVAGLSGRYPIWHATVRMIRDHVWLGTGPATWEWMHLKYRDPRLQIRPQYAHNDVLQLASDYGLIGAALVVIMLACFYRHAWRLARQDESVELRAFALGSSAAVTAILVHSFVDFNLHIPANAMWLVTLMALTVAPSSNPTESRHREFHTPNRFALAFGVIVVAAGLGWFGARFSLSARDTAVGYNSSQEFEWARAQTFYERARRHDPGNPEPLAEIGDSYRMQSSLADAPEDSREQRRFADLAVNSYRESLRLNPYQSEVMLRLAAAYELAGDIASAARTYGHALAVDPNNAFSWLRLGMFGHRQGDIAGAIEALRRSQQLNNIEPIADQYLKGIEAEMASQR